MVEQRSLSRKMFIGGNYAALSILTLLCLLPVIHIFAVSLSASSAANAGLVGLWPVDFTWKAYSFVLQKEAFLQSFLVSLQRVSIGLVLNMSLIVLAAYPLSKEAGAFRFRTWYAWFFVLTMLFNGGLIPTYLTIRMTGLLDTIWALLIPTAVPVFSVVLLLNFFRGLPRELEEAAFMDGAGYMRTLLQVYIPLSMPAIATLSLFSIVMHWNSWFDGLIYMNSPQNYPLQSYLQTLIIQHDMSAVTEKELQLLKELSDRTVKSAQIFLAMLPILCLYPFMQKYFIHGIVLGSVKE
ncbi:carbohydrate ABC transporter permease [Paenibacillus sp. J5C_2022]|uniref:carbohydrate ABC transporter permease n=1 Tax=Paenibacillus sp. J5C2022 TaxID=2977129 RepID=UPI0021D18AF8|nr:carbohydrate ABC transporter permease [Paenibacillus sp. J5C2022]MCU6712192.1 carbohydrate ABC transporter permease [Paenibacillus sp. J5C2022]